MSLLVRSHRLYFQLTKMGHATCQTLSGLILDAWSFAIVYLVAAKLANSHVAYLIRFCFLLSFVQPYAQAPIVTCITNREQQVARSGSELSISLGKMEQRGAQPWEDCRGLKAQMQDDTGAPRCNSSASVSNCSSEGCNLVKKAKPVLQVTHRTKNKHTTVVKSDGAMSQWRKSNVYSALTSIKNDPTWTQGEEEETVSIHHPKAFPGRHGKRWLAVKTPPCQSDPFRSQMWLKLTPENMLGTGGCTCITVTVHNLNCVYYLD